MHPGARIYPGTPFRPRHSLCEGGFSKLGRLAAFPRVGSGYPRFPALIQETGAPQPHR